jgi:predicted amidophosphoribosyltransferase
MSALVVEELELHRLADGPTVPSEDTCLDCGAGLAEFDEVRCADCADLAAHAECRDCGAVLRDADIDAGVCTDCLA